MILKFDWMLDAGCLMLVTGCWILDAGYWLLDTGCLMLVIGYWVIAKDGAIFNEMLRSEFYKTLNERKSRMPQI